MSNRKIVFINQSTGYLTIDILNDFATRFDEIALIYGEIRVHENEIHPKVKKYRVTKKSRVSNIRRFIRWFAATIQIFWLLITKFRKYEVMYFSLPPFAYLCSLLLRNKFSVVIFDVYPDALKILNISESNFIYRNWSMLNKLSFRRAHKIYTISESMAQMLSAYTSRSNITVVPLWTGFSNIKPIDKSKNPFIQQHGLAGKFIIQYSGNIGPTYSIESLIQIALKLKDADDICFLIIGRGVKVPLVNKLIESNKLNNCLLLPFQPDDFIKYSIAAADLSIVMIDEKVAHASIPSKVFNIMAVGSPILSMAPRFSELYELVTQNQIGVNFDKNDFDGMVNFILEIKSNHGIAARYTKNSLETARNYTSANAAEYYKNYN